MAKPTIASLKAEIKEYQDLIDTKGVPQDEKDFAAEEISNLQTQLKKLEGQSSKETPAAAKRDRSAEVKKRVNPKLEHINIEINGEKVKITEANCYDVVSKLAARIESAKKAQGKYKTKPITEKVASNLTQAASQAIEAVSDTRMQNKPNDVISGAKMIEKAYEKIFEGFEKMTGKKIPADTKKQIQDLLDKVIEEATENK